MIKRKIRKLIKGFFAIFTIKLALFTVLFIIQACQKDDNYNFLIESEKELAIKKFEKSLKDNVPKANKKILDFEEKKKYFTQLQSKIKKESNIIFDMENFEDKTEEEVKTLLLPLVYDSKELLFNYGITENDLEEIFFDIDILDTNDPSLIVISEIILAIEKENKKTAFNYSGLLASPVFAYQQPNYFDCALRSIGVTTIIDAFKKGIKGAAGKALLKKAIKKVALRALGWVGAAVAVYEFGRCMEWWQASGNGESGIGVECTDLVRLYTKNNSSIIYLSKKDINYVTNTDHDLKDSPMEVYQIYTISHEGEIGSKCFAEKTGQSIAGDKLIITSIQPYIPLEFDDDEIQR